MRLSEGDSPSSHRHLWFFLRERLRYYFRAAGLFGLGLIVVLSIIPGEMQIRTSSPKGVEHFVAYLMVALALVLGYRQRIYAPAISLFLIAVAGALELFQTLVPGRTATLADWEAGTMGAIFGTVFAVVLGDLLIAKIKAKR